MRRQKQNFTPQERRAAQQANAEIIAVEKARTDDQDALYQQSMITYVGNQNVLYQNSMTTYVNNQNVLFQNSMTTYVNNQNVLFQNSMIDYVATQVAPKANKSYVDSQDTNYYNSAVNVANTKMGLTGADAITGLKHFADLRITGNDNARYQLRVNLSGAVVAAPG